MWLIAFADAPSAVLDKYLAEGYEPFAVVSYCGGFRDRVYLRKRTQ